VPQEVTKIIVQGSSDSVCFDAMIADARAGDAESLGDLLQRYQNYLRLLVTSQLRSSVGRRVGESDIVQEAMLAAHRDFSDFRGHTPGEFAGWLRTILARTLLREIDRHVKAEKRDVRREVSFESLNRDLSSESIQVASLIAGRQPSPSEIVSNDEQAARVANLISALPKDYQTVVMLRNFNGLRFEEIATQMGRTSQAVRLLWLRAIKQLRKLHDVDAMQ
jgi:RNA polymerase sigma-70 factor, ECF subfamily